MKTSFDTSHINIDLNTNLISGVWTNVSMADGHIQECGESEKVENKTKNIKTLDKVNKTWTKVLEKTKKVQIWTTNNNKT